MYSQRLFLGFLTYAVFLMSMGRAAEAADYDVRDHYTKHEYMVPMRDGTRLYTQVYIPKDTSQQYPILLTRTPYGVRNYGRDEFRDTVGPSNEFAREGYIVAYQDVRGKFRSEGTFIHRPPLIANKSRPEQVDESSDAYDTIDWLLKNIDGHNGRVGTWGISAGGYTTAMSMINAHPALKAASPQAAPGDQWIGDDYHHYGAFRLAYAFNWTSSNARTRGGITEVPVEPFNYGTPDGYRFFLELGPISNVNARYFQDEVPTWNEFMRHPDYDEYWQGKNVMKDMKNITFAVLNVIGWFDAEDYYGPWGIYHAIERNNPQNLNHVVVGPWSHGGWARGDGDRLGHIQFGSKTAEYYRREIELPFFNQYLKNKGALALPKAIVFETGSNTWRNYDAWPPRQASPRNLYLHEGGRLSFTPPTDPQGFDEYVSDPAKPVPFTAETRATQGHLWIVEDQRFAATRPDVLVYESEVLEEDVTIAGAIMANLFVETTGTDADLVVKLIDVFPGDSPDPVPNPSGIRMGDFQFMLAGEVFRAKYHQDFSKPVPLVPGAITPIKYDLLDKFHTFKKGHRIMVQIQSSWFPLIDRNPQTFVNIYEATASDFKKATHRIHRSASHPTHLQLNVIER
ncbi:CocE/NonD family hydrolase [Opitutaceae bacterium]